MSKGSFWLNRWVPFVVNRPAITVCLTLIFTILLGSGITGVSISASPREYMGIDSSRVLELVRLENEYTRNNNVLEMFSVDEGTVFEPKNLEALAFFTERAWQLPYVQRVDSITNFQYSHAEGDDLLVENLVPDDPSHLSEQELSRIRAIALNEPRLAGFLVSKDGKSTAVNMTFTVELHDSAALLEIEKKVDELVAETKAQYPGLETHETGFIEVCLGWLNAMTYDAKYMFTSAFLLMCVALFLFFRGVMVTTLTMLLAVVSVVASLGLLGHFNAQLHPPALIGTLVILMLALADSVHIVNRARKLLAQGCPQNEAIIKSLQYNIKPVFITSLTTAIGFLSFLSNDFTGIRLMGAYIAFGVMYACLLSVTLLPAAMTWVHLKPGLAKERTLNADNFSDWVFRFRWLFVVLVIPVIVTSGVIIVHTQLDDSAIHYISSSQPFRKDQVVIEKKLTGSIEIVLELDSGEPEGVSNPQFMAEANQFSAWLRQQPGVRSVSVYTDTMKHLNRNMHGEAQESYSLPEQQDLASQYLLLYELSLPYGLDLTNQINLDKSATRLSFTLNDTTAMNMMALSDRIDAWLKANAPHITATRAGGDTIAFSISNFESLISMFYGALVALLIIGIVLLITFRHIMPGTLCTIMVISPLSVCFGIWSLAVGYFDTGAVLTLSMVIGIVVDNAVHFVSKYQLAVTEMASSPREAVRYVVNNVGAALIINTLVLAAGFSILIFSAFTGNSEMGKLTVMNLLVGLVGTFTLLPSLLVIWGEWQNRRSRKAYQQVVES